MAQFDMPVPERRIIFNPVVSTVARTLPQWRMGFQRTSGANINADLLANALSIGVFPRMEVGTVPLFYRESGSFNYAFKVNFYKGEEVDWASSYTETRFKSEIDQDGKVIQGPDTVLNSVQVGMNYHPVGSDFTISPFGNNVCGHSDSTDGEIYTESLKCKWEWGTDVQWQFKDREWITIAYGFLRDAGLSPYSTMNSGLGVAWSQFRPKELISRPSVGIYYSPQTNNTLYLVSTTFYEL